MKKFFALAAAILASFNLFAADPVYYKISDASSITRNDSTVLTWTFSSSYSVKNTAVFIEVPDYAAGQVFFECNGSNTSRWLYINVNGTQDESRKMAYAGSGKKVSLNYTSADFTVVDEVNYLKFTTSDDYKIQTQIILTYLVNAPVTAPVDTVGLEGEENAYVGVETIITAAATPTATAYKWFVNGEEQEGETKKTFAYTPETKGNFSVVCKARNDYNEENEWIASDALIITASKLCGELIKATRNGKNIDPVTGIIGGSAEKNTQDGGKLGSNGHYWKLTLASGNFMVGDTVIVNVSTAGAQGAIAITSDKAGSNVLGSLGGYGTTGDNKVVLTKGGVNTIWLSRDGTNNTYNGVVDAISVKRPCEESSNADIAELSINGEAIEAVENVYSYTVAATVDLAQVAVAFSLAHPLASADKESPFNITVPAGGDPANTASITVTAEDGTEATYTISVCKSAAASTDATLKSLKIDGVDVADFAAATLEYSKEYEYDYTAVPVVSAEANDANATVNIDQAEAVPGVATITVTAEDGETQEVYTVNLKKEAVAPIIRATSTGNTTATISGTIGGTSEKSTQGDKFGGKGNYWGLTLNGDNTFKTGDTLHVIISQAAQQGTIALYDDQDGANLIYNTEALGVVGDNVFVFPAAMNGKKTFYICRDKAETNKWNAFVTSISVKRKPTATSISTTSDAVKAQKRIENGQLVIEKNGKVFNAMGQTIR